MRSGHLARGSCEWYRRVKLTPPVLLNGELSSLLTSRAPFMAPLSKGLQTYVFRGLAQHETAERFRITLINPFLPPPLAIVER